MSLLARSALSVAVALLVATPARAETKTPAPTPFRACPGALDHSSTSIHGDDGRQTLTVKLSGTRCAIDFRLEGKVQFNDDFTDIASLSADGSLRLDVTDDGERYRLEIEPGREGLVRTWRVNGREQPYDAAAREWFAAFLIELDRRTAVGVDQRLPVLLRKGGVTAVLAETAQMPSEYSRGVYYSKLAAATRLSNADLARVLDQAASMKTSDYYASELIKDLGARAGADAGVRAAVFRTIQSMTSDYYRAEAVQQAVGSGRPSGQELEFLIDVVRKMDSDYYKTEVLKKILALDALTESDLVAIVKAVAPTGSEYYRSEMLHAVLAHRAVTDAVRQAVLDASGSMSSYYRDEMVKATGRR